ncbi:hypothetical protein [Colwellia sp. C1TZA3]|uniref:hypothetical protein n=1 Tax=Colwellia sp. C1TZA3 TaxID=2508879 RepID=UPI0011B9F253|nr:hypothetical protein [Colwellia sp. C1TZA3]TWX73710.1 hypothetical protein ESZ39_02740 [Colwellia sp. C1TZA3]
MKLIKIIILVAIVGVISNFVTAANLTPDLVQCANMKSEKQRLQCFDAYIDKNSTKIAGDITVVSEPKTTEIQDKEQLISSFGQAHRYSNKERKFDEMTSIVKSARKNLHKKWEIELENGQIWIEKGGDRRAKFSEGDAIIITRGIMNSFKLKKVGTKRRIRVNRTL